MKSLFCLPAVAVCLFSCCAFAGVSYRQTKIADAPFDMPVLDEPVFPERDFAICYACGTGSGVTRCRI